jgi:hypothetical protein
MAAAPTDSRRTMAPTSKLRVATPDVADALDVVKVEVEGATGFAVEPQFQEIDRADLVVEMRLTDSYDAEPGLVARAIERSASGLEVLSTWKEVPATLAPAPRSSPEVFDRPGVPMPEVARRALHDDIPTAQWFGAREFTTGDVTPQWHLAVPVVRSDGLSIVGVQRRRGYTRRFCIRDAAAARLGLAS